MLDLKSFFDSLVSKLGSGMPELLVTLAILIIGVIMAKWAKGFIRKLITKSDIQDKLKIPVKSINLAQAISSIIYYVIILNVLLIVLERMEITTVLDPLKELASQFMNALPRIIGAGIILYAGWIIAKLVTGLIEIPLEKLDEFLAKKQMTPEFKVSKFLSAFLLGAILLPVVVSSLEFLSIDAISKPAISMIQSFMSSVPNIVGAGLILLVFYFVGKFIVFMLTGLLEGMNIDEIPKKAGFQSMLPSGYSLTKFIGSTLMFFIMLAAATSAVEKLNIEIVSNIFARIIDFSGGIVLGGVILLVGAYIANTAYNKLIASNTSKSLANILKMAILGLVFAMGLKAMGLADSIVQMAFGFTLGAVAIATSISFGVGGIDAAKKLTNKWLEK